MTREIDSNNLPPANLALRSHYQLARKNQPNKQKASKEQSLSQRKKSKPRDEPFTVKVSRKWENTKKKLRLLGRYIEEHQVPLGLYVDIMV